MAHLFVENLTHIDCSLLDRERGLIGASWIVDVELVGKLNSQSMVLDFSKVKKQIKMIIDEHVDHKLLVPEKHEHLIVTKKQRKIDIQFTDHDHKTILHHSPPSAITLINSAQINKASINKYLSKLIKNIMPDNVAEIRLNLREEEEQGDTAYYCYSHGLKKHDGNCQRIAHGHRSKIRIWKNHQRKKSLEEEFAKNWCDIYLGTEEDVSAQTADRIRFEYQTGQGKFMLELPKHRVHLMQQDSTIECIAQHIASILQQQHPDSVITVQAFEGINKGAFAKLDPI